MTAASEAPDAAPLDIDGGAPAEDAGQPDAEATHATDASAVPPQPQGTDVAAPGTAMRPRAAASPTLSPNELAELRARRAEAEWPLAYVDRPQTMFEGMSALTLGAHGLVGPDDYRSLIASVSFRQAFTERFELWGSLSRLLCDGEASGDCGPSLSPTLGLDFAVLLKPSARLKVGASTYGIGYSADFWARLKLVVPHSFSFEIEPRVTLGLLSDQTTAWWSPRFLLEQNQSREQMTFDANFQLTERLLLWADLIPYVATSQPWSDGAVAAAAGVLLSFSKTHELEAQCENYDVRTTRRWEYVRDVSECSLLFVWRDFLTYPGRPYTSPRPHANSVPPLLSATAGAPSAKEPSLEHW